LRKKSGKGIGKGKRVQRENHKGRGKARFFVGFYFSPFPFGCPFAPHGSRNTSRSLPSSQEHSI
ncbi:MAG: hypothetical protein IJ080_03130, partial [Oscillospiraceae bacterium]|nr:hypothetical protein [Oscillospiraceae bacterium]